MGAVEAGWLAPRPVLMPRLLHLLLLLPWWPGLNLTLGGLRVA